MTLALCRCRGCLDQMDTESPFSSAFSGSDGWRWVSNVIGVGAAFGILTSLVVSMLGQARYLCVIGRSHVVPPWLARVHPATSTPVNASAFLGTFYIPTVVSSGCKYKLIHNLDKLDSKKRLYN